METSRKESRLHKYESTLQQQEDRPSPYESRLHKYESRLRRQLSEKRENRRERIQKDLERYGKDVLKSEEMEKAFSQKHHLRSSVGEHTMRVASSSLKISYALKKLHIDVNIPTVVVGSLCHDLGILGRKEKYASSLECSRKHPGDSVEAARTIVGDLPEKTEHVIERHMWPIGRSSMPDSIEGAIVSIADKYSSVKDLIKGSGIRHRPSPPDFRDGGSEKRAQRKEPPLPSE